MARSHHRPKKHHPLPQHPASPKPKRKAAATVFTIFLSVFGLGIGYFATGSLAGIISGAIVGGGIGYLIGHNLDKMAGKK